MDGWEADQGANREPLDVTAILAQPRQALERIAALEAELADVRAQWAADIGSAVAMKMTAEAALKRVEQERDAVKRGVFLYANHYGVYRGYSFDEMVRMSVQRADAARKVAAWAREHIALEFYADAVRDVNLAYAERDAARAEAARLRAALESVRGDVANNERHLDIVEYINAALRGGPAPAKE